MRVVSVPGRTVRHWVTGRVIDAAGILHDPFCVTAAFHVRHGDLKLVNDDGSDIEPEATGPNETRPEPAALPDSAE